MVGDRRISRKRKGNVLSSYVTPAYINDEGTYRETTREGPGLREKKRSKNNRGSLQS